MNTTTKKTRLLPRKNLPRTTRLIAISILSIILLYSLANVYIAMQTPTTKRQTQTTVQYTNNGRFFYLVHLKNNTIYNNTILFPGEGIYFAQLLNNISASFTYTFTIDADADVNGTYIIQAFIKTNLWTKTYTLVPRTSFSGSGRLTSVTTAFPVNYTYYASVLEQINAETGVQAQNPELIIQSTIDVIASTTQGTISASFSPSINATLGQRTITISEDLVTTLSGALTETQIIDLPAVSSQRTTWSATTVFLLLGLFGFAGITTSTRAEGHAELEIKKIKKKYSDWLVEADQQPDGAKKSIIMLKSIDDLAKIGEELGKPIIHFAVKQDNQTIHSFYVVEETTFYEHILKPDGKITVIAPCSQCGTSVTYEDYPGSRINTICPNCGNKGIVAIEKSKDKPRKIPFFSRSKKTKLKKDSQP